MYSNVNTSSLEQLDKLTSGPVSPAGVLRHDGSAHGTRGVSVKPRGHALLAEDVFAGQHDGLLVAVLTYRTEAAAGLYLLLGWSFPVTKMIKRLSSVSSQFPPPC